MTACNGTGGDPKADGDIVDGGTAAFPVTAEYAGMTWSITKAETKPFTEEEVDLLVDLTVTNNNPFGMRFWHWSLVNLKTADGVTLSGDNVGLLPDIGVNETIKDQLTFRADSDLDINGLSLIVGDEGHISEVVPFAGGAEAKPYPVDLTVEGKVTTEMSCPHSVVQTMTAVKAKVDIGAFDVRASIGHRLVVLDLHVEVAPGDAGFLGGWACPDMVRIEADGEGIAVARQPWPGKSLAPGTSSTETYVFEIPVDTAKLELVIYDWDEDSH